MIEHIEELPDPFGELIQRWLRRSVELNALSLGMETPDECVAFEIDAQRLQSCADELYSTCVDWLASGPSISELIRDVQPCTAEKPTENPYQHGKFIGVMETLDNLREVLSRYDVRERSAPSRPDGKDAT